MSDLIKTLRFMEHSASLAAAPVIKEAADEIERLRAIVAVFEADEALQASDARADSYCPGECIAPKLRAAYQQTAGGK